MAVHSEIKFSDLSYEKQQELIDWIKTLLIEDYLFEGENILNDGNRHWHVAPRTKEEAYCRVYAVGSKYWAGMDEKSQEFKDFDWTYQLTEYAAEEAERRLNDAFKYTEIEIELK